MAAHRAGIKHIILPQRNGKDLKELPNEVQVYQAFYAQHNELKNKCLQLFYVRLQRSLKFTLVGTLEEVLMSAFKDGLLHRSKL